MENPQFSKKIYICALVGELIKWLSIYVCTHRLCVSMWPYLAGTGMMCGSAVRPDGEMWNHKHKGSNPHDQHAPTKPAGFAGPSSTTQVCDRNQTGERCDVVSSGYQAGLRGSESETTLYGCNDYVNEPVHHHSCNESTYYIKL